jgi:Zn-finger nucleic acid-binding protein
VTNAAAGMPCPVCKVPLVMSERQGVEIDYCPQCRGVWLDRGELDKIIERGAQDAQAPIAAAPQAPPQRGYEPRPFHGDDDGRHRDPRYQGKRRKSFFEELFD